jgi:hypothetical protein
LRLGLYYQGADLASTHWSTSSVSLLDSAVSVGGEKITVRETQETSYDLVHHVKKLSLDAAYIFRTKGKNQLKAYGGLGVLVGTTLNSKLIQDRDIFNSTYIRYGNTALFHNTFTDNSSTSISKRTKNFLTSGVYVPVGLDFRWSNNHKILSKFHSTWEFRASFEYAKSKLFSSSQNNFGLKVDLF